MKIKTINKFFLTIIALGATALTALSQGVPPSGVYSVRTITLPSSVVTTGTPLDLSSGWSVVTSITNTYTAWNTSSNAFVTTTNITTTTNTTYADMPISNQKDLAVYVSDSSSAAGTNVYTIAFGIDSTSVDPNNTTTVTVRHTAANTKTGSVNIPRDTLGGFGVARIITVTYTAASGTVTNNTVKYAIKRTAN